MSNVVEFMFENKAVRTVVLDGEGYFVAKDICDILGYENSAEATKDHCKFARKVKGSDLLGASDYAACRAMGVSHNEAVRTWNVIPERDVYRLIMRSKKPEAEKFEEWVVGTVLPSIRKTGGYIAGEESAQSEDELIYLAMQMMERKIREMKPKAEYHDQWMSSEGSYTISEVAKRLGISAIALNKFLRQEGVKWQNKDLPKVGYESWFKIIDYAYQDSKTGMTQITTQCRVSPDGVKNIVDLYQKKIA